MAAYFKTALGFTRLAVSMTAPAFVIYGLKPSSCEGEATRGATTASPAVRNEKLGALDAWFRAQVVTKRIEKFSTTENHPIDEARDVTGPYCGF